MYVVYNSIYHREKTKNARARDVEECVGVGRARAPPSSRVAVVGVVVGKNRVASEVESNDSAAKPLRL